MISFQIKNLLIYSIISFTLIPSSHASELLNEMKAEAQAIAHDASKNNKKIEKRNSDFRKRINEVYSHTKKRCKQVSNRDFPMDFRILLSSRWSASYNSIVFLKTEFKDYCIAYFDTSRGVKITQYGDMSWFIK